RRKKPAMLWKLSGAAARATSISSNRSAGPPKRWEAKMFPASFGYVAAHSVEEALQLLTKHGEDAKLLAGGDTAISAPNVTRWGGAPLSHCLSPGRKLRLASPRTLIDLGTVEGLRGVRTDGNTLVIGALTVHTDVA